MQSFLRYNRIDYTTAASCATLAASEPGLLERGQYKRIHEARNPLLFSPSKSSTHRIQLFFFPQKQASNRRRVACSTPQPQQLHSHKTRSHDNRLGSIHCPSRPSITVFPPTRTVETANRIVPSLGCSGSPPRSQSSLFRDGRGANR